METRFSFTGKLVFPKEGSKQPFVVASSYKDAGSQKEIPSLRMNVGIREGEANTAYISAFGSADNGRDIFSIDKDNNKISVAWKDRFDADVVESVASYRLYTVDLADPEQKADLREALKTDDYSIVSEKYGVTNKDGADAMLKALQSERKQFITSYDFIEYLSKELPKCKHKVTATGRVRKRFYKDRYSDNFEVTAIYAVTNDTKEKLSLTMDLYYNKDCVDATDLETEKRIYVNGYVQQYINKDEGNKMMPQQAILDLSKYQLETNPRHKQLADYKRSYLEGLGEEYVHMNWEVRYLNGADVVEFTKDLLTPAQLAQVELGIKNVEDFKPRGNIFGERVVEYRLADPKLMGDFADGLVKTGEYPNEFEAQIYIPNKTVNIEAEVAKVTAPKETKKAIDEISEEDLF